MNFILIPHTHKIFYSYGTCQEGDCVYEEETYFAGDSVVTDSCVWKECTSNGEWTDQEGCLLSDGETCVENGYNGPDNAHNFCNTCTCSSGALMCTRMACNMCDDEDVCLLNDGTCVENGWTGSGAGSNYCNTCSCMSGVLACTEVACPYCTNVGEMDYSLGPCQPRECMENGEYAQMIIDCAESFGVECDGEYVPPEDPTTECCSVCREGNEKATSSDDFSGLFKPTIVSVVGILAGVVVTGVVWYVRYNRRAAAVHGKFIIVGENTGGKESEGGNAVEAKSTIESNAA